MKSFAVEFAIVSFLLIFGSCLGKPDILLLKYNKPREKNNLCVWDTYWSMNNQAMLKGKQYSTNYNVIQLFHDADWKASISTPKKIPCKITENRIVCPDDLRYVQLTVTLESPAPAEGCYKSESTLVVKLGRDEKTIDTKTVVLK